MPDGGTNDRRTPDDGRLRHRLRRVRHHSQPRLLPRRGFEVTFEYGQPPSYACLCRDEVGLHLLAAAVTKRLPGHGGICIFVRDVDQVYAELSGRGARLLNRPEDRDYRMRDFDVVDADGNQLTFGMGTDDAA
ncbi:catechol 2,3-dioxygenase-like lactoylglutathione lyase family enzyme [Bradyrhizobium elkanii]|uniref:VOC family protein n=1 Tax=Bradyrhizobium TaxID=374 RepID=UPI002167B042|nr:MULTISPECIES: VOC family protein [Bradyrhizobium]MCS3932343.1 catechol 2,3-dioxygenase-like lactoylglutathione lyase family enzyme [Bradyrhizobium elkanii]MCS3972901.1 catechol 2,3-dioxygenase-like lactoylglutathione lyase family enzyme [Bradyrhizobium japonicum]